MNDWIQSHGPLWPSAALLVVLDACARASRLSPRELTGAIGSLDAAHVRRSERDGWEWTPQTGPDRARAVSDADVVERLGALLFHGLVGRPITYPVPSEPQLRAAIRAARPELPPASVDLCARAATVRSGPAMACAAFARQLREALGIERPSARPWVVRAASAIVAVAVMVAGVTWRQFSGSAEPVEPHGLTRDDTTRLDVATETGQDFALMGEHTAAYSVYDEIEQIWGRRVAVDDPRLAWAAAQLAWVRTLAGDRLTTEQLLTKAAPQLAGGLHEAHPYTRTARLDFAATLEARGARDDAAALRAQATESAKALLSGTGLVEDVLEELPTPPGVIAHTASDDPIREGFRKRADGGFFAPLTAIQRWRAGHEGWRLHVAATGACSVSVDAGDDPRRVDVSVARAPNGTWRLSVRGTTPPVDLTAPAADKAGISLLAGSSGDIRVLAGNGSATPTAVDRTARQSKPPYALAFGGPATPGCAVVWLEIPFSFEPMH